MSPMEGKLLNLLDASPPTHNGKNMKQMPLPSHNSLFLPSPRGSLPRSLKFSYILENHSLWPHVTTYVNMMDTFIMSIPKFG